MWGGGGGKWGLTQGAFLGKVSFLMTVGCHCRVLSSRITWTELCYRRIHSVEGGLEVRELEAS